jgi:hypothetical protein
MVAGLAAAGFPAVGFFAVVALAVAGFEAALATGLLSVLGAAGFRAAGFAAGAGLGAGAGEGAGVSNNLLDTFSAAFAARAVASIIALSPTASFFSTGFSSFALARFLVTLAASAARPAETMSATNGCFASSTNLSAYLSVFFFLSLAICHS